MSWVEPTMSRNSTLTWRSRRTGCAGAGANCSSSRRFSKGAIAASTRVAPSTARRACKAVMVSCSAACKAVVSNSCMAPGV